MMKAKNSESKTNGVSNFRYKNLRSANFGLYLLMTGLLFTFSQFLYGQASNADFERLKPAGIDQLFSSLSLSPDGNSIAMSFKKASPVKIMDWKNQQVTTEFNAGNWLSGSKINYSSSGKYLLLEELNYVDFSMNKDQKIDFELIDASTGQRLKLFEQVQDVVISSDESYALSLSLDEVTFWNLPDLTKQKSFKLPNAANAIALSPDGKTLVVSNTISEEDLMDDIRYRKNKKATKFAIKYKQMVSLYDTEKMENIKSMGELYDIVYNFSFSPDGNFLFVYQIPQVQGKVSQAYMTYVNMIDLTTKEPIRKGFTSQATGQPAIKFSSDGKLMSINSKGTRFQEIHLYDFESGTLLKRFELGRRLFEKSDGEKLINDSRPSFTFLPGDQAILIAIGNQLIQWNFEINP